MKENTKFLWMYVAILFSFALILIVFAGLSRNFDEKETVGLKNNVISVTEDNQKLQAEKNALDEQIARLTEEKNVIVAIDEALFNAIIAKDEGDDEKAKELISVIDPTVLTESQLYIYNKLKN